MLALLALTALLFAIYDSTHAQSNSQRFPDCKSPTVCTQMRRCLSLRVRGDWRTTGITCGLGTGPKREVCCPPSPQTSDLIAGSTKYRTSTTPAPTRRRPVSTTSTVGPQEQAIPPQDFRGFNKSCGLNLGGSWFQPYIMGGSNASEGTWPWMVAIRIREDSGIYTPLCSGFLIDRIHVLSAAHCFEEIEDGLYTTRIGSVDQKKAEEYQIRKIKVHEGWSKYFHYDDIALVTLAREVDVPNFMPICLPDERIAGMDLDRMGTTVAGWGSDRPRGKMSRFMKQLNDIPVVSNQKCSQIFREEMDSYRWQFPKGLTQGIMCAGFREGEKDACWGDSGGPLMFQDRNRWFAVGIVSFGYKCGEPGIPSGYVRVSTYLDWIRENMKE